MIGIIGGTGLYNLEGLTNLEAVSASTPYGQPSGEVKVGMLSGKKVAFLPRHGAGHSLLPSEINFRANIWALKSVGVTRVVSVSATGSLEKEIKPGDLAIPDQYVDWTQGTRKNTFFGEGLVAHISTAEPACKRLTETILQAGRTLNIKVHSKKTYVCVEGPRLGTRAESLMFQANKCHLVGMTNVPEVFLAREAQICYSTIAIATDYDCWLEDATQHVSVEKVFALYKENLERVIKLVQETIKNEKDEDCTCRHALTGAVVSPENTLKEDQKKILAMLSK